MALPLVLSTSKVKPLTPSSGMRRAAGQNEARSSQSQFAAKIQHIQAVGREAQLAEQSAQTSQKVLSIFPQIANLLMPQATSHYKVLSTRAQAYETVAASNELDESFGLGQILDMHA